MTAKASTHAALPVLQTTSDQTIAAAQAGTAGGYKSKSLSKQHSNNLVSEENVAGSNLFIPVTI